MPKLKIIDRRGHLYGQGLRLLMLAWLLSICYPQPAAAELAGPPLPQIEARSAILIDYNSGRILYSKVPHDIIAIASTTKITTAIVALEHSSPDEVVTGGVDDEVGESVMGLAVGEKQTMHDLLYGMMLPSGNDAAMAIARHVGARLTEPAGEKDPLKRFVDLMNQQAQKLGMHDTHYGNPHGLDEEDHTSSVYDLAIITWYAMHNPTFAEIVRSNSYTIPGHYLLNTNELLSRYPGADGVKTGLTDNAGLCLVGSATRNGQRLISVVLHSPKWYDDSKLLLDYGFASLEAIASKQIPMPNEQLPVAERAGISWLLADALPTVAAPLVTAAPTLSRLTPSPTPLIISQTQGGAQPINAAGGDNGVAATVLVNRPVSNNDTLWAVGMVVLGLAVALLGKRYGLINPALSSFNRGRKLVAVSSKGVEPEPVVATISRSQHYELSYADEDAQQADVPLPVSNTPLDFDTVFNQPTVLVEDGGNRLREHAWRAIEYSYAERQGSALVEFMTVVKEQPRFEFSELPGFYEMPMVGYLALARAYYNVGHPRFASALLTLAGQRYPGDLSVRIMKRRVEQDLQA